jgi:hypothetical protein
LGRAEGRALFGTANAATRVGRMVLIAPCGARDSEAPPTSPDDFWIQPVRVLHAPSSLASGSRKNAVAVPLFSMHHAAATTLPTITCPTAPPIAPVTAELSVPNAMTAGGTSPSA